MATDTDRPATELMQMLEREPEFDRSEPLGAQAIALLRDIIARCERAEAALRIDNLGRDQRLPRYQHLQSKGEGLKLAISYMEEELRMSLPSLTERRDDGPHGDSGEEDRALEGAARPGDEAGEAELAGDPRAEQAAHHR